MEPDALTEFHANARIIFAPFCRTTATGWPDRLAAVAVHSRDGGPADAAILGAVCHVFTGGAAVLRAVARNLFVATCRQGRNRFGHATQQRLGGCSINAIQTGNSTPATASGVRRP